LKNPHRPYARAAEEASKIWSDPCSDAGSKRKQEIFCLFK